MEQVELTPEEKAKIAHNEYNRKWRAKNKAKLKEYEQAHWLRVYERTHGEAGESDAD